MDYRRGDKHLTNLFMIEQHEPQKKKNKKKPERNQRSQGVSFLI